MTFPHMLITKLWKPSIEQHANGKSVQQFRLKCCLDGQYSDFIYSNTSLKSYCKIGVPFATWIMDLELSFLLVVYRLLRGHPFRGLFSGLVQVIAL